MASTGCGRKNHRQENSRLWPWRGRLLPLEGWRENPLQAPAQRPPRSLQNAAPTLEGPALLHAGGGQQNRADAHPLQQAQAMPEGQPVDEDRRNRIDEGQGPGQRRRQLLDRPIQQHVHHPGMHDAQGQQAGPGRGLLGGAPRLAQGASNSTPVHTWISAIRCGGVPLRRLISSAAKAYSKAAPRARAMPSR